MPAARLADVGARDPHPLVFGRRGEHLAQQVAVARLNRRALAQHHAGAGDPLGERVANSLKLFEAGYARLAEVAGDRGVEVEPREGLDGEARELVLEAGDLSAQLSACEALIASHSNRAERVSIEQIRHKTRTECRSRSRGRERGPG